MSDAMNEPVTRGELRAELADMKKELATKAELREELAAKADKADLVPLATKAETKAELHSALEIWGGALREELKPTRKSARNASSPTHNSARNA